MTKTLSPLKTLCALAAALQLLPGQAGYAGMEIEAAADKDKIVAPLEKGLPPAMITLGGKFSSALESGYLDSLAPFWDPGDFVFFLNTRTTLADDEQSLNSYGLGVRYRVPDQDVILGANAYYDSIHSQYGNEFDQLGLGAEVLTHWVDARFNYYLPENTTEPVDHQGRETVDRRNSAVFQNQIAPNRFLLQQTRTTTVTKSTTRREEVALEGWNAEIGFLVPGLDKYMELRLFAGAYGYNNIGGSDYVGFKTRAEAHLLPGVIADVEYWDDAYLTGGHWTGELRVTMPFSIYNLATGRNPFEGAGEMFHPRQREFSERVTDMVMRSHRVYTTTNTPPPTTTSNTTSTTTTVGAINRMPPPVHRRAPGGGGGGGEGGEGGECGGE